MDEDLRNAFGILMCTEICDGTGVGICDDAPSTCFSLRVHMRCRHKFITRIMVVKQEDCI